MEESLNRGVPLSTDKRAESGKEPYGIRVHDKNTTPKPIQEDRISGFRTDAVD